MTMPPRFGKTEPLSRHSLEQIAGLWRAAALGGPLLERIDATLARSAELRAEHRAAREHSSLRASSPAGPLAAGEMSGVDAAVIERNAPWSIEAQTAAREVHSRAQRILMRDITRELRAIGDELITEHLAPAHDAAVTEAVELLPVVAGIVDDRQAIAAAPETREAWARLTALAERRDALVELATILANYMIVTELPPVDADFPRHARLYVHPHLVPRDRVKRHPVRALAWVLESGAEPGIYTAAQVAERPYAGKVPPGQKSRPVHLPRVPAAGEIW